MEATAVAPRVSVRPLSLGDAPVNHTPCFAHNAPNFVEAEDAYLSAIQATISATLSVPANSPLCIGRSASLHAPNHSLERRRRELDAANNALSSIRLTMEDVDAFRSLAVFHSSFTVGGTR
jgi:hypothetical protein